MSEEKTGKDPNEIGALWRKESSSGNVFYTGMVTVNGVTESIVLFETRGKPEGSKRPDWRILRSNRPNTQPPAKAKSAPAQAKTAAKPLARQPYGPKPVVKAPVQQVVAEPEVSENQDSQENAVF